MGIFALFLVLQLIVHARGEIWSICIFGDSLVDYGNNNNNPATYAKANYIPYGRDYPGGPNPTGRFTNEFVGPDYIASYLKLPLPQPYFSSGRSIREGVNFASGGSGLYNTTGNIFRIFPSPLYPRPMALQVQNFIAVKNRLISESGLNAALELINKTLLYITYGSNDIANNYYLDNSPLQSQFTISQFIDLLIDIYGTQLKILYREGARKFVIASLFPLGCSPLLLIRGNVVKPGQCNEVLNAAAREFNNKLGTRLSALGSSLPEAKLLYANSYDVPLDAVRNPASYGFSVGNVGCCNFIGPGPSDNRLVPACLPLSPACRDASKYVYWDQFHSTSRVYRILADLFWNGSTDSIQPINIQQLAAL